MTISLWNLSPELKSKLTSNQLQKELLWLANFKVDYNQVADEIYRLRELKQNALVEFFLMFFG